jgi:hypothetical protein
VNRPPPISGSDEGWVNAGLTLVQYVAALLAIAGLAVLWLGGLDQGDSAIDQN